VLGVFTVKNCFVERPLVLLQGVSFYGGLQLIDEVGLLPVQQVERRKILLFDGRGAKSMR